MAVQEVAGSYPTKAMMEAGTWNPDVFDFVRAVLPCRCCETRFATGYGAQPTEVERWRGFVRSISKD